MTIRSNPGNSDFPGPGARPELDHARAPLGHGPSFSPSQPSPGQLLGSAKPPSEAPHGSLLPAPAVGAGGAQAGSTSDAEGPGDSAPKRRSRRGSRGGRRRRAGADGAPAEPTQEGARAEALVVEEVSAAPVARAVAGEDLAQGAKGATQPARRKRQRRPRRGAEGETPAPEGDGERGAARARPPAQPDPGQADEGAEDGAGAKRRRRGNRGGRKRKKGAEPARFATQPVGPVAVDGIPGEEDDLPELLELPEGTELLAAPAAPSQSKKKRKRKRKSGRAESRDAAAGDGDDDEVVEVVPSARKRRSEPVKILVNASDREETRVAVVRNETIVDFQMTVASDRSHVNDIYRGRVVNLETSIGAAFVDFGRGRNGFLHTSDVLPAYGEKGWSLDNLMSAQVDPEEWDAFSSQPELGEELLEADKDEDEGKAKKGAKPAPRKRAARFTARQRLPITDLLRNGDPVVVQVTKDAIGDKGPTLTTFLSITGHYLVLMPFMSRMGVSRKIEGLAERKRLRRILDTLETPEGMGVIVRTAGEKKTKPELQRDLDELLDAWKTFGKRLKSGHGPMLLYQEPNVSIRTVRDCFGPEVEEVVVDDPEVFRSLRDWAERVMPDQADRIRLHEGDRPIFNSFGVEADFERIFSRRIELPAGGSIVFDQAEALVAIDVNSGRTRSDGHDFEDIALKTNLEAVPEIARQIRLRDLGGIIVIDFIDMMKRANVREVERAFREALASDRARSKMGRISQFGLLEMTRQRLGPGTSKKLFTACARCRGTGRVRTVRSRATTVLRRLGSALTNKGFSQVEVRAHPETIEHLERFHFDDLRALEDRTQRKVVLTPAVDQLEDSVLRYLRVDGREVRPGGRRKR